MKKIIISYTVALFLLSSCKKENNTDNSISIRCNNYESIDCLTDNWAGLTGYVQITEDSYDGSNCLLFTTDSMGPIQNIYTYVEGLDSNQVYRISLYAKYKKVTPHLPYQGHSVSLSMYPWGFGLTVFDLNNNSNDPIDVDWKKYTEIFQNGGTNMGKLNIRVSGMDSVWIDNISITKF